MFDFSSIKKIINLLYFSSSSQKKNLFLLNLLVIFSSIFEVFSVYLIIPVYKVLVNKELLNETIPWINTIFKITFKTQSHEQFFAISFFAIIFIFSNLLKTFTTWLATKQAGEIGAYLFSKAYSKMLAKPYELLLSENLSKYASNFLTTNTIFISILKNIIIFIGYFTTSIILIITLLILNTGATLFSLIFLLIPYLIILKFTKPQFKKNSSQISSQFENINRYMLEAFKSLKTIKHFQVQNFYTKTFYKQESRLRERMAFSEFLEQFPRNILEALGLTMLCILYGSSILLEGMNIPIYFLIALIFSCQKLLPAFQQIYRIYAYILAYSFSISDLYEYFHVNRIPKRRLKFLGDSIKFKNVFYSYHLNNYSSENSTNQKKNKFLLNNINLEIQFPSSVSITGDSGCGKTTFVDLLTGLLSPSKGYIFLPEDFKNSKSIGYVPQEVPLINGSFLENLCFGNKELIEDENYLSKCLNLTGLTKIIDRFPLGLNTILGERAINLSGGQKQRIGIARALLIKPKILVLDESTNALDELSQNQIIDNLIYEFSESLIIFITHNNNIKNKCMKNIKFNDKGEIEYI